MAFQNQFNEKQNLKNKKLNTAILTIETTNKIYEAKITNFIDMEGVFIKCTYYCRQFKQKINNITDSNKILSAHILMGEISYLLSPKLISEINKENYV